MVFLSTATYALEDEMIVTVATDATWHRQGIESQVDQITGLKNPAIYLLETIDEGKIIIVGINILDQGTDIIKVCDEVGMGFTQEVADRIVFCGFR